jgi:hypothetical protein
MKVNTASKRKFTERNDAQKAAAEKYREQEQKDKRMKTLEDYESTGEINQEVLTTLTSRILMLSDGANGPELPQPQPESMRQGRIDQSGEQQ